MQKLLIRFAEVWVGWLRSISLVIAITVMVRSCSLNSIKEGHFLVARCVPALVNVRVVAVKRNHGGNGSQREDEGQCCDEGLHGWSPLGLPRFAFEQRHPMQPRRHRV